MGGGGERKLIRAHRFRQPGGWVSSAFPRETTKSSSLFSIINTHESPPPLPPPWPPNTPYFKIQNLRLQASPGSDSTSQKIWLRKIDFPLPILAGHVNRQTASLLNAVHATLLHPRVDVHCFAPTGRGSAPLPPPRPLTLLDTYLPGIPSQCY